MDTRLLRLYNRELQSVRELGAEFAREFPKVAGRLGLEGLECADPYVERLIESFAFLAARVQLKLDAQFPRFTQHLLEMIYPQYLSPTPSMLVAQLQPGASDAARLETGYVVPRGTALRGALGKDLQTACEYRTAHDTTLWPVEIRQASYTEGAGDGVAAARGDDGRRVQATLRLRLGAVGGVKLHALPLDRLALYLHGDPELTTRLHEALTAHVVGGFARAAGARGGWREALAGAVVRPLGFEDDEALLPVGPRAFQGYRLLHEYFAFPARFAFVELGGLAPAVRRCVEGELELAYLLDACDRSLAGAVDASHLRPSCTPAVNLFPRATDRIHLAERTSEHHVVPDRSRPLDFEVHSVQRVVGYGSGTEAARRFLPFYAPSEEPAGGDAYFTVHRVPRVASSSPRPGGPRSSYGGSEVFVSLVDGDEGPFGPDLKQLSVEALCTNRDLPLLMPIGTGRTDFHVESGAPVEAVRCLAGPTAPRPPHPDGELSWRLISHLSLNYLSITDGGKAKGAAALRELLRLYADVSDPAIARQIEGVVSVASTPAIHRLPLPGPLAFARGLDVAVTCDESAFEGVGVMRLGAVLERFFARYVSINTATATALRTVQRGELRRWPARIGARHVL